MYPSPQQPFAVKRINQFGRVIQRLAINTSSLNPDRLIKQAQKQTGLGDFGDSSFREGLDKLVDSLETEAMLSLIGRMAARGMLIDELKTRLQIIEYRKQRPELQNTPSSSLL